jgi:hypothetical protein
MSFADDFKRHAAPRLRAVAKAHATFHALGDESFVDAHAAVHAEAAYLGAGFLPAENYDDLCDQITSLILNETDAAEISLAKSDETNAAALAADPVAYYEALVASSHRPDEALRWAYASICPEYRAYLIAQRRGHAR